MFDPEKFGTAMGLAIRDATAPLLKRIDELEAQIAKMPVVQKDDPGVIKQLVAEAVAALPVPVRFCHSQPRRHPTIPGTSQTQLCAAVR